MLNTDGSHVLIVDDDAVNRHLFSVLLGEEGYQTDEAKSGEEALARVKLQTPDIILLDVMMPGMDGFEVARRLKEARKSESIPIIMITALNDQASRERGLLQGVEEFITKPVNPRELKIRVRNLLRLKLASDILADHNAVLEEELRRRSQELLNSFEETLYMLMRAAEYRDGETGSHVRRISHYTKSLAADLGMDWKYCETIFMASPMHDIGKIGVPDQILLKPGALNAGEWEVMQRHTTIGGEILNSGSSPYMQMGKEIALSHHERWDGSGYPYGLVGEDIPLSARIMSICDVYDALRSKRPYKSGYDHAMAIDIIRSGDDRITTSHFDPDIMDTFLSREADFGEIFDSMDDEQKQQTCGTLQ
ncbi:MAG: response regulator [Mariprofundaceae bacterium]|nr:response regulator [Mariprofundaceae bacterium]